MPFELETHHVDQYKDNVRLRLQQKVSKLRNYVTVDGDCSGEAAIAVDLIGNVAMQRVGARFSAMTRQDAEHDRVWMFPLDYELPQLIDQRDLLRAIRDPQSKYVQNAAMAAGREIDDILFDAFFESIQMGRGGISGYTSVNWDTAYDIADTVGGSGMNTDKLLRAGELFLESEVDMDEPKFIAMRPRQHKELLTDIRANHSDYNGGQPILKDGRITYHAGFNIIVSNRVKSATYRECPVWVPRGVHLGIWQDIKTRVDERPDLTGVPVQLYQQMTFGATRTEAGLVQRILCSES